jgi:hypothetical protein
VRRVLVVLLAGAVAAGCGGGGEGKRLTRQEFDAKGNAICKKYNAKQKAVGQPNNINELGPTLRKLLPIVQGQVKELRKLKPPKEDEQAWNKLLARADKESALVKNQLLPAVDKHDIASIQKLLNDLQTLDQQNDTDARNLGLGTCAQRG